MEERRSFAEGLNYYKLFWIFFIGSFIGVVIETLWCLITNFKIESRTGLIFGPFNPVYGFGAMLLTIVLGRLYKKRKIILFGAGFVIGGIFEYLCSIFQEKVFGSVSWDYSKMIFNINGRTNLVYCIFWGVIATAWIRWMMPRLSRVIEGIPNTFGIILTWILTIFIVFDMSFSSLVVERQWERYKGIEAKTVVQKYLDANYSDETLKKIYPNMIRNK